MVDRARPMSAERPERPHPGNGETRRIDMPATRSRPGRMPERRPEREPEPRPERPHPGEGETRDRPRPGE